MEDYLGFEKFLDLDDTTSLVFRLSLELLCTYVAVQRVYAKRYTSSEHVLTFWMFSIVTFSIAFLLRKVPMELGFALGLFAVFGVLRYRTEPIGVKDLTYLFVVIGLALINALANKKISIVELLLVDSTILGGLLLIDGPQRKVHEEHLSVLFDRIDLLGPGRRPELLAELGRRMSIKPTRVAVQEVDLLRDTARLMVYFPDSTNGATPSAETPRAEGSSEDSLSAEMAVPSQTVLSRPPPPSRRRGVPD